MRQFCTSGSVGAAGGQPPAATRARDGILNPGQAQALLAVSLAKTRSEGSRPSSCSIGAIGHGPQERQRTRNRSKAQRDGSLVRGSRYPSLSRKAERPWLRSATDVAVVESADLRHCHDIAALGWLDRAWLGRVFPESEMRARGVIVAEAIAKATTEVSFVQHDHVVEEFAPDGSDHALSEWVLPRGARRGEDLGKTDGLHPLSKLSAEDAVAIADEKPGRRVVGEGLDKLLRRPSRGRGVGHVEMYDSAAVMEEDYEHVEHAERRRGHDEEVDRDKIGDVIFEEGPPGLRGRFRTARHEPTNRAL